MGATEHRRSQGELRKAVTWFGAAVDVVDVNRQACLSLGYTTKPQGLGIGLSISRSIAESHGGRLWAEANAPHGAVFALSLPVGS